MYRSQKTNQEQYFIKAINELKITEKYLNLLKLDKIYYGKVEDQPYFYNVDSSEVIAELMAYRFMNTFFQKTKMDDIAILLAKEAIEIMDYSKQGDKELKKIYVEENAKDKTMCFSIYKFFEGIKTGYNLFNIESYDIKRYEELWDQLVQEYNALCQIL